ncbi:MAG: FG-GAP repeat domain-containing protein [Phycisphaerae bacterium]
MPHIPSSARVAWRIVVSAVLFALLAGEAFGLINVNFTPVDLYHRADAVATARISRPDEQGLVELTGVAAVKGELPQPLSIRVDTGDERLVRRVRDAIGSDTPAEALLLWGDFSAAAMAGMDVESPAAMLHVGTAWIALYQRDDGYEIRSDAGGRMDPLDLKTVWAGSTVMLRECLEYIASDPRAEVPSVSAVMWEGVETVAELPAPAGAMLVADMRGEGEHHLLVGTPGGDRLYEISDGSLNDVTESSALQSRSDLLTVGDFDGDGRVDIASWNAADGELVFVLQQPDGKFTAEASATVDGTVKSLSPACGGEDAAVALVVGTEGSPVRAKLVGGELKVEPIAEASPAREGTGPCVIADFDGDGLPDVFQTTSEGALFYKGIGEGAYAEPESVTDSGYTDLSGAAAGDFDADGKLDVLLTGREGAILLVRDGEVFRDRTDESGELDYIARPGVAGLALGDINNDGRQEPVLLYPQARPHVYFNRGFRCFGYAADLEESLDYVDYEVLDELETGQSAGVLGDFTGSGGTDLVLSTTSGKLLLLRRQDGPTLSLTVTTAGTAGPAVVRATDGRRDLGARLLLPAQPVIFGKTSRGPLDVTWRMPGADEQSRREIVTRPSRLVLPADDEP